MKRPTAVYFLTTLILNITTVAAGTTVAGTALWILGLISSWSDAVIPTEEVLVYALCVSALMVFVLDMWDLVGSEIFTSLLRNRHRRPRSANRVFLLIELMESTSYAEQFGDCVPSSTTVSFQNRGVS